MINRGFAVLPLIAGHFDMVLGESVRTTFDAGTGRYSLVSELDYEWQRQQLWAAGRRDPNLQLFSLDYWDPNDKENIAKIYTEERANGFIPYVARQISPGLYLPHEALLSAPQSRSKAWRLAARGSVDSGVPDCSRAHGSFAQRAFGPSRKRTGAPRVGGRNSKSRSICLSKCSRLATDHCRLLQR